MGFFVQLTDVIAERQSLLDCMNALAGRARAQVKPAAR